jgi:AraC family ethanolamine operon transcriptional activator
MDCFQLGRGKDLGQMDTLDLGSQQIVRETQRVAVQKLGVTPPNLCTLSCCTPDPTARFSELGAGDSDATFFMPGNTEFDVYVPAGVQTSYVSLDQEEFLRAMRVLNPAEWERTPDSLIAIPAARQTSLKGIVRRWLEATRANVGALDEAAARHLLLQDVLQVVATTRPEELRPSALERSRAFLICQKARAFVEDSLAADVLPGILDVCAAVGVSERTLQYAFRAYVDMSPLAYLRSCRLNRVRAVLRASDRHATTVTEVATRFGFLHLGRFSVDYRRVFEESPSATLAS